MYLDPISVILEVMKSIWGWFGVVLGFSVCFLGEVETSRAASGEPRFAGVFGKDPQGVPQSLFEQFKIYAPHGDSSAELHLIGAKGTCRYSLQTYREDRHLGSSSLRFQGSKIECDMHRANTVSGMITLDRPDYGGQIRLLETARRTDLQIEKISQVEIQGPAVEVSSQ